MQSIDGVWGVLPSGYGQSPSNKIKLLQQKLKDDEYL